MSALGPGISENGVTPAQQLSDAKVLDNVQHYLEKIYEVSINKIHASFLIIFNQNHPSLLRAASITANFPTVGFESTNPLL